jgi:hypothetical protein
VGKNRTKHSLKKGLGGPQSLSVRFVEERDFAPAKSKPPEINVCNAEGNYT